MRSRHTYRNLNFFSYDSIETAKTSQQGERTLSDWNRHVRAGKQCGYYINGVQLSEMVKNKPFATVQELENFYKKNLFTNMTTPDSGSPRTGRLLRRVLKPGKSEAGKTKHPLKTKTMKHKTTVHNAEEQTNRAAKQACYQWHQAGIQHATYQHASKYSLEKFPLIGICEPTECIINFKTMPGGVTITEENVFRQWKEKNLSGTKPKDHIRDEKEDYYAKTQTTYLFTADSIEVADLLIDCPSVNLAPLFDTRPQADQEVRVGNRFLRSLYSFLGQFSTSSAKSSEEIPSVEVEASTKTKIGLPKR